MYPANNALVYIYVYIYIFILEWEKTENIKSKK